MDFRVEIAPRAFEDLDAIATYIRERGSSESAERWFNETMDAIRTLGAHPNRCPIAQDVREVSPGVRVLLHGRRNRQ